MPDDLESWQDIADRTDDLLRRADAYDRFPTAVDDLIVARQLSEPDASVLAESTIAQAPPYIRRLLTRVRDKTHALLDRRTREVHVNPDTDRSGAGAFKRLHEVGHDLLEWQHIDDETAADGFADDRFTLSPATAILFEREANQAAAELLFQRDRLQRQAADYAISIGAVAALSERFGASFHATFRRFVETHRHPVAGVVLGGRPASRDPVSFRRREALGSSPWCERFEHPAQWPRILAQEPFSFVQAARRCGALGPPEDEWTWVDRDHRPVQLNVEAYTNTYSTFVLIWLPQSARLKRRVRLVTAA